MNSSDPRSSPSGSGHSILLSEKLSGAAHRHSRAPAGMARRSNRPSATVVTWLIPTSRPWLLFGKSCALARGSGDTGFRMLDDPFKYGLLIALAIALLFAGFTDLRSRRIDNWLNAGIALAAP